MGDLREIDHYLAAEVSEETADHVLGSIEPVLALSELPLRGKKQMAIKCGSHP